jgi:hypothetical protein
MPLMSEDEIERGMEAEEAEDAALDETPRPVKKDGLYRAGKEKGDKKGKVGATLSWRYF